ncbi:hypothetical protein BC827DRAFT_1207576 [Russula dissimulans]|nr:hypothetical protein BC827DRAFT_1207576 [Russula dissimulans]
MHPSRPQRAPSRALSSTYAPTLRWLCGNRRVNKSIFQRRCPPPSPSNNHEIICPLRFALHERNWYIIRHAWNARSGACASLSRHWPQVECLRSDGQTSSGSPALVSGRTRGQLASVAQILETSPIDRWEQQYVNSFVGMAPEIMGTSLLYTATAFQVPECSFLNTSGSLCRFLQVNGPLVTRISKGLKVTARLAPSRGACDQHK